MDWRLAKLKQNCKVWATVLVLKENGFRAKVLVFKDKLVFLGEAGYCGTVFLDATL